jgi:hypothetical protein
MADPIPTLPYSATDRFAVDRAQRQLGSPFQDQEAKLKALTDEIRQAPELSFLNPETNEITLGRPMPIDIYQLYEQGYAGFPLTVPQVTDFLVEAHKLPSGSADRLRETMTDSEIIQRLAFNPITDTLYRDPGTPAAVAEALRSGVQIAGPMTAGAYYGGLAAGAPGAVIGGGTGLAVGLLSNIFTTPQNEVLPQYRNPMMAAEFLASSAMGVPVPFMLADDAVKSGARQLLPKYVANLPYIGSSLQFLTQKPAAFVDAGMQAARQSPRQYLTAEAFALPVGAGAGYLSGIGETDPTWTRMGFETFGTLLNPQFVLAGVSGLYNTGRRTTGRFTEGGRKRELADQIALAFEEVEQISQENGLQRAIAKAGGQEQFDRLSPADQQLAVETEVKAMGFETLPVLAQRLGENSELERLLKQAGLDIGNPTSAERAANPILYDWQNSMARVDPGGFGRRIQNRMVQGYEGLQRAMGALLELNDPDSLAAFAAARDGYFRHSLETGIARGVQRYRNAMESLTAEGQIIDENKELFTIFDDLLKAARKQEAALYDLVDDDKPTNATFFLEAAEKIGDATRVGRQSARLDPGSNTLSLKRVLTDFEEMVKRENPESARIMAKVLEELRLSDRQLSGLVRRNDMDAVETSAIEVPVEKGQPVETQGVFAGKRIDPTTGRPIVVEGTFADVPAPDPALPDEITSGQLKTIRKVLIEGMNRERPGSMLGDAYGKLLEGITKDLRNLPGDSNQRNQRALDNAISFTTALNETFGNTFVGRLIDRDVAPELLMKNLLKAEPSEQYLALQEINNAVNFFERRVIEGDLVDESSVDTQTGFARNTLGQAVAERRGQELLTVPPDATDAEKIAFAEINREGERYNSIELLEERVLRSLFQKFKRTDPETGELRPDVQGIAGYLEKNPDMRAVIELIDPPTTRIDPETGATTRESALLNELLDVETAGVLFNQTRGWNKNLEKIHKQLPLMRFLNTSSNPGNAVGALIGVPGRRTDNPVDVLESLAGEIGSITQKEIDDLNTVLGRESGYVNLQGQRVPYTPAQIRKTFYDSLVGEAFKYAGGTNPDQPFSFQKFKQYMEEPMIPGRDYGGPLPEGATRRSSDTAYRQAPSVLDVLRKNRIITAQDYKLFDEILDEAIEIEGLVRRAKETGDKEVIEALIQKNPISVELVTRVAGAKVGTSIGDLIPGAQGSELIAASAGSKAMQALFNATPLKSLQNTFMEMLQEPALAKEIFDLAIQRQGTGRATGSPLFRPREVIKPISIQGLRALRSALVGAGAIGLPEIEDLLQSSLQDPAYTAPERRMTEGERAAVRRRAVREQAPPPQAMTDQAQQFMPQMPMPQVAPPVAQAPANPNTRAQFAAMYPNDITSDIIRTQQGIGSLLGNV